jgi:hypothetical protein
MNKTHEISMPSKFVRYLQVAHHVILLLSFYYLTDLGKGGTLEKIFYVFVLAFFILSILSLIAGTIRGIGEDFWFVIAFQFILVGVCLWMVISYLSKEAQLALQIFDQFNLETAAYLYLIPGSLLSLWTGLVFLKMRKVEMGR